MSTSHSWQQLIIVLPQPYAESVAEWLEDYALSVSLMDACDEPLYQEQPTEMPLWQTVQIESLFLEDDIKAIEIVKTIQTIFPAIQSCTLHKIAEQDWVRLTQSQFPAQCFNQRLWVYPSWEPIPPHLTPLMWFE
jgi:ribosomal protein L11 methyltransferase